MIIVDANEECVIICSDRIRQVMFCRCGHFCYSPSVVVSNIRGYYYECCDCYDPARPRGPCQICECGR